MWSILSLSRGQNMKAFIIQFPFGVVAFDEEKALVEKVLFINKASSSCKKPAENRKR